MKILLVGAIVVSNDVDMTNTRGKDPFILNTILASQDPLALDCIAVRIAGVYPNDIPYLEQAAVRGVGELNFERIRILGTPLKTIIETWKTELRVFGYE